MSFRSIYRDAKFIASRKNNFPYFRKKFTLNDKIKKCTLAISALGFCEIYINNKKVNEELYVTTLSHYNDRKPSDVGPSRKVDAYFGDKLGYTIYVSKYDVTDFLAEGENALGVVLAGGWYRSGLDKHKSFRNHGDLKLCFRLSVEYANGETCDVFSDEGCKCYPSFLINAGIFHEDQDERLEILDFSSASFDDEEWDSVDVVETPKSKFKILDCPVNKVVKYIVPTLVNTLDNTKIYALPENITGYPIICGKSSQGDEIVCKMGETLDADNTLNEFHCYDQHIKFISDGRDTHYIRFTWHGFQYFSISTSGDIHSLDCEKCAVVYADIPNTSNFQSSSKILNFIYDAYIRCQNENFQCGVPTDCPQIERKGYTGDGQLLCDLGMNLFNSKKLYKKWLQDIADSQDKKTGYVHYTAPSFVGCSGGPGGWSSAIVNVPYMYYKTFGDVNILKKYYPNMKKYLEFMDREAIDGLVEIHKRDCACLGDWAGPYKPYLPTPFVNSCLYVEVLQNALTIARALRLDADCAEYQGKIEGLKANIDRVFFDLQTGNYCNNEQAANAFALNIGLGDERTLKNLVDRYRAINHFDTGIFGTKVLVKVLFEKGYSDLAVDLLCSKHSISYYSWRQRGATTLWEAWENPRSLNHPMFGAPVIYFFTEILGIKQTDSSAAYSNVIISPQEIKELPRVNGSLKTVNGRIKVQIVRGNGKSHFEISIPKAINARFEYKGVAKQLVTGKNIIDL